MDKKHREVLRRQRSNLRRDLEVMRLLPKLSEVLDSEDEEEVKAEAIRRKMVDKLLNILPKKGPKAFDVFVKGLQEIQPFLAAPLLRDSGKEEMKTEFNCSRMHSSKLRERARAVTKEQQKEIMESRLQLLETTIKQLKEELSTEKSQKEVLVEDITRLKKECNGMKEDIRILKKILEERKEPIDMGSDKNKTTCTSCEEGMRFNPRQEELVVVDRIPNALEHEKSLERREDFSFSDRATSPEGLKEFNFDGNQTCSRCGHKLEEELYPLKTKLKSDENKIQQLELKIKTLENEKKTLENEKKHREMEITELREANARLKVFDPFGAHVNKLEQHIENLSRELENINKRLVKAARRNSF